MSEVHALSLEGLPIAKTVDLSGDLLTPYDWVIDQFIYEGTMMISGAHGVGKTSSILPLCLVVCGAIEFQGVKATIQRDVIYSAEDVEQCKRILHGLIKHTGADGNIVRERLHLLEARRKAPHDHLDIVALAHERKRFNECPAGRIAAPPLTVLDTVAAHIDMRNESDPSEVSQVVSGLRSVFRGIPLWLPSHVAKSLKKADVTDLSTRGASSWEADTQGSFYLYQDQETEERYFYGGKGVKRRDQGEVTELRILAEPHMEDRQDRYGHTQKIPFLAMSLELSCEDERVRKSMEAKEQERLVEVERVRTWLMAALDTSNKRRLDDPADRKGYPSREDMKGLGMSSGFTRAQVADALTTELAHHVITEKKMTNEERAATGRPNGIANYLVKSAKI